MTKLERILRRLGACEDSRAWAKGAGTMRNAWKTCENPSWLLWISARCGIGKGVYVVLAREFAPDAAYAAYAPDAAYAVDAPDAADAVDAAAYAAYAAVRAAVDAAAYAAYAVDAVLAAAKLSQCDAIRVAIPFDSLTIPDLKG